MNVRCSAAALCLVFAGCAPAALPLAGPPHSSSFITTLGADTVAVETLQLHGNRFEGRQVIRSPRTMVRTYSGTLDAEGAVESFAIAFETPDGSQPTTHGEVEFGTDSATVRIIQGDSVRTMRVAAPRGTLPSFGYAVALYELPLRHLQATGQGELRSHLLGIGGQPIAYRIEAEGGGSYRIHNIAGQNRASVDAAGRLQRFDGRGSTLALIGERVPALDLPALTQTFLARDAAGAGLGALSPRDTARAALHGAELSVEYGRPYRRGRQIWGELVPYGQVWRTGANQATHLHTTRDLEFEGRLVPAGSYSLWAVPTATGGELIINRQTGQWGTAHDPAQDLVRVPLRREVAAEGVEQFTISVERTEQGGQLRLAWDDAAFVAPFRVR